MPETKLGMIVAMVMCIVAMVTHHESRVLNHIMLFFICCWRFSILAKVNCFDFGCALQVRLKVKISSGHAIAFWKKRGMDQNWLII